MSYFRVNVKIPFYVKFIENNILRGFADGREFSACSFCLKIELSDTVKMSETNT
jgi:hypothetical protein